MHNGCVITSMDSAELLAHIHTRSCPHHTHNTHHKRLTHPFALANERQRSRQTEQNERNGSPDYNSYCYLVSACQPIEDPSIELLSMASFPFSISLVPTDREKALLSQQSSPKVHPWWAVFPKQTICRPIQQTIQFIIKLNIHI